MLLQGNVIKSLKFFYPLLSRSSLSICATILHYAFKNQNLFIMYLECLISTWLMFCLVVLHYAFQNQNLHIILKMISFKVNSALCNSLIFFNILFFQSALCSNFECFNVLCNNSECFHKMLNVLCNNSLCFQIILGMFDFKVISATIKSNFNILCFQSALCNNFECFVFFF
jgi:hypothetical protein